MQVRPSSRLSWLGPNPLLRVFGCAAGIASITLYGADGYSTPMLMVWLASFVALTLSFETASRTARRLSRLDLLIPVGVAAAFAPLYLLRAYSMPVQVGSDEVALITVTEKWANRTGVDPFGLSDYFTLPVLPFLLLGRLAELVGDIDLETLRRLHGVIGVVTVAVSYAFFRQLLSRPWALVATCLLGFNHAFLMFNRMAMHQATSLLIELLAFALLLYGLRHSATRSTFLGGAVAGVGLYVYYPARAVFPLWLLFLLVVAFFKREISRATLARMAGIATLAFALVAGPVVIAESSAPAGSTDYQKTSLLVLPEGRALAREWVDGGSTWEGIRQNIVYGVSAFNNTVQDHGWLYPNEGHGFLDPLTGVLLWVGVLLTIARLRSSRTPWPLLALTSLVALWLTYTFLINKAPHYGRLLLTLPFVAYFATEAIRVIAEGVQRLARRSGRGLVVATSAVLLATMAAWNVAIAADFAEDGRAAGDDIGSTGRYVRSRSEVPGIRFYMAASDRWPYYEWGWPSIWQDRLRVFARHAQVQPIVLPAAVGRFEERPPFVLFLSRALWNRERRSLERRYPDANASEIMPDGSRIAFEVRR